MWKRVVGAGLAAIATGAIAIGVPVRAQDDDEPKSKKTTKKAPAPAPKGKSAPAPTAPPADPDSQPVDRYPPKTVDEHWREIGYALEDNRIADVSRHLKSMLALPETTPARLQQLREQYGSSQFVRLAATPELGAPLLQLLEKAREGARAKYSDPARLKTLLGNLSKSESERIYAVEQLQQAGEAALPAFAEAIRSEPAKIDVFAAALAQMPRRSWPAVATFYDSGDAALQTAAVRALRAWKVPASAEALWYFAGSRKSPASVREEALKALGELGLNVREEPAAALARIAMGYYHHRGLLPFSGDITDLWTWEEGRPQSRPVGVPEAEHAIALRTAGRAREIDSNSVAAAVALVSVSLDVPGEPNLTPDAKAAATPAVLTTVLNKAMSDRRSMVVLHSLQLLSASGAASTDVFAKAFDYPNSRVQFLAAAAALARNPTTRFKGADRIVPILARAIPEENRPAAVLVDGDIERGNATSNQLRRLGYETEVFRSGRNAFLSAAASNTVELVVVEPTIAVPSAAELIRQLRADARTASIPVLVFEYDPPVLATPEIRRPLTEYEAKMLRDRHDWQVRLEGLRAEMYEYAVLVPEREKRIYSIEQRVQYLARRMGYIEDPVERAKAVAEVPETVAIVQKRQPDTLELQERTLLSAQRAAELGRLADRYPAVAVFPRVGSAETLGKALKIYFGGLVDSALTPAERKAQQTAALGLLERIAAGEFPYLDGSLATPRLAALLTHDDLGPKAASILAKVRDATAQKRLAEVVLADALPTPVRIASADALAENIRRSGRVVDNATAYQIVQASVAAPPGPLGDSLQKVTPLLGANAKNLAAKLKEQRKFAPPPPPQPATRLRAPGPAPKNPAEAESPKPKAAAKKKPGPDDDD